MYRTVVFAIHVKICLQINMLNVPDAKVQQNVYNCIYLLTNKLSKMMNGGYLMRNVCYPWKMMFGFRCTLFK